MNNKIILSIAVTSFAISASAIAGQATDTNQDSATTVPSVVDKSGGKCASGKCGTEKRYAEVKLESNPQDKLTRSRDGKCGISGTGQDGVSNETTIAPGKCSGGVCGQ